MTGVQTCALPIYRVAQTLSQFTLSADVLQYDDGIVDDDSDRQYETDQGNFVDAVSHGVKHNQCAQIGRASCRERV